MEDQYMSQPETDAPVGTATDPTDTTPTTPTVTVPARTSEVLRAAMTLVQTNGWTQGDYVNRQGNVCATMAIQLAGDYPRAYKYFEGAVATRSITLWNDAMTTTFEDVILGFKRAAEIAERNND
jgi:hypothetical protein